MQPFNPHPRPTEPRIAAGEPASATARSSAAPLRPTAAKGRFPYPHRTVAEVDFDERPPCAVCGTRIVNACSYPGCPGRDVA